MQTLIYGSTFWTILFKCFNWLSNIIFWYWFYKWHFNFLNKQIFIIIYIIIQIFQHDLYSAYMFNKQLFNQYIMFHNNLLQNAYI